ncbi:SPW repeat protein [Planctomycetaceae bacterium SH139]
MRIDKERKTVKAISGVNVVAGVWLIAAPFVLGFTGVAGEMWNHIIAGLCVLILAVIRVGEWHSNTWMSWGKLVLGALLIIVPWEP